jgi:Tfp pilus assembly protein PilW
VSARDTGFSLLELTIALGLTLALMTAIFTMMQSAHGASAMQPETADLQQRLRVAVDVLTRDLMMAGAGAYVNGHAGPLNRGVAPVLPFRRGAIGSDPAGTFKTDTITLLHVPTTSAQTALAADFVPGSLTMQVAPRAGCAAGVNLCGFSAGMTMLAFDGAGAFQTMTVAAVVDPVSQLRTTASPSTIFRAGTPVVEVQVHTYSLKADAAAQTFQLIQYDGTANADVPVLDHVVGLAFDYYGDPMLAGGMTPVTAAELTDGPWRPDAGNPDRWDVDLLRIRSVGVMVRLEAALAALRGPAGVLFTNGGTARDASRWIPDQEIRFRVSPRNLNLRR